MKHVWIGALAAFIFALSTISGALAADRTVYSVIVMRHGVRSISKTPPAYAWADWSPVAPDDLTAHGYRLITYEAHALQRYFSSAGMTVDCRQNQPWIYADIDQRTLYTGRALIEGMCGTPGAIPLYHRSDLTQPDPLFERANAAAASSTIAPQIPSGATAAFTQLLQRRCGGPCGATKSATLKELSTYAEDAFLEWAQCRPAAQFAPGYTGNIDTALTAGLQLHVAAYNAPGGARYDGTARAATIFAHIIALLQARTGQAAIVQTPASSMSFAKAAIIVGHDSQLGALGGLLDAHWTLPDFADDDMPPGSALIFELHEVDGAYVVQLRFAHDTLQQFRSDRELPDGTVITPVGQPLRLDVLTSKARTLMSQGLTDNTWTNVTTAEPPSSSLHDPQWSACAQ